MTALTVEQTLPGSTLGLISGLSDLLVIEIGGRRVLYALSRTENRLVELEIAPDGSLTVSGSLAVTGTFSAGSSPMLGHVTDGGGAHRLTLAGLPEADGQSVTLSETGGLGAQQSMIGAGSLTAPVGIDLSGTAGMVAGRAAGGGLDLFTDTGNGFTWQAQIDDAADRYLADVAASVPFELSGDNYLATVSASEDGVNIVSLTATAMAQAGALGPANGLPVNTPTDIGIIQRLDETLLVVSASGSSSLSVITVDDLGAPIFSDHVLDADWTYFQGAEAIATATFGDFAFVAASGAEGGVSLFTVLLGGRLVHLASHADDTSTTLYRVSSLELAVSGSALQIYGSSYWEAGVTRLGYDLSDLGSVVLADGNGSAAAGTAADDQVIGSDVGETLSALGGNDILFDGAGSDILSGGAGADLFVLHADGVADQITDFDRGQDRLDLSAFDFLYDISQLTVTVTADGAILSHGSETITIHMSDGAPLTKAELTNDDILNVDRPPFLAVGQELVGSAAPDILNGGAGPDTIVGAGGDDTLSGSYGDDSLVGGAGFDLLDGGGGADTLRGQSEGDTLIGGSGDDLIFGDGGDDVIYGDDIA